MGTASVARIVKQEELWNGFFTRLADAML